MFQFWQEGVSLWYAEDYLTAMSVWRDGLDEIGWEPILLPWQQRQQKSSQSKLTTRHDDNNNNNNNRKEISSTSSHTSPPDARFAVLAPLYLFLAGCYLDAQEFDLAETLCRQGLNAILHQQQHDNDDERNQTVIRLIQELMSCWEENPAISTHCQQARSLLQWLHHDYPTIVTTYWPDPWQRPAFSYRGLPSQAVCPRSDHPAWCRALEDEFAWIQQECQTSGYDAWQELPVVGSGAHRQGAGAHDGTVVNATGDWREAVLFGAGESPTIAPRTRTWLEEHCPDAVSLARQGGGEAIISVLAPHTRIAPHCASTNLRWTAHLGLRVPTTTTAEARVQIRIADTWHSWQEGRVLVFDDSYEHEVVNYSDEIRVVLLLRFWNPHLALADRRTALPLALQWKEQEQERRFHPPTPPMP